MKHDVRYIVGIDEAGRGPLAGPVAVGVVLVKKNMQAKAYRLFKGMKESKQISENKRGVWFKKIEQAQKDKILIYCVRMTGAKVIDKVGINRSIRRSLNRALKRVICKKNKKNTRVILDGGLYAPKEYANQQTIIKGDEKKLLIALASIVAKVTRDKHIRRVAQKYPKYKFEAHKGYGTAFHIRAVKRLGVSAVHRRTFLTKIR